MQKPIGKTHRPTFSSRLAILLSSALFSSSLLSHAAELSANCQTALLTSIHANLPTLKQCFDDTTSGVINQLLAQQRRYDLEQGRKNLRELQASEFDIFRKRQLTGLAAAVRSILQASQAATAGDAEKRTADALFFGDINAVLAIQNTLGTNPPALALRRQAALLRTFDLERAIPILEQALQQQPDDFNLLQQAADWYLQYKKFDEAHGFYRRAMQSAQALANKNPLDETLQHDLAESLDDLGDSQQGRGKRDEALQSYQASWKIRDKQLKAKPDSLPGQFFLAQAEIKLGGSDFIRKEFDMALSHLIAAETLQQKMVAANPTSQALQNHLAATSVQLGDIERKLGKSKEAFKYYQTAHSIYQALVLQIKPQAPNALFRRPLLNSHMRIAELQRARHQYASAQVNLLSGLAIQQKILAADPSNVQMAYDTMRTHFNLGLVYAAQNDHTKALASYQIMLGIISQQESALSKLPDWQANLAYGNHSKGDSLRKVDDLDGALASYQLALSILQPLTEKPQASENVKTEMMYLQESLGILHVATKNPAQALQHYRTALEINRKLLAQTPKDFGYLNAGIQFLVAIGNLDESPAGQAMLIQAITALEELKALAPLSPKNAALLAKLKATDKS